MREKLIYLGRSLYQDSRGMYRIVSPLPENNASDKSFNDRFRYYLTVVEESFLDSGLKPNEDYDFRDILSVARPMILEAVKTDDLDFYWTP